jgi:hypothetical protein
VLFLMGPMASLTALSLAVCVSSRVNDALSAAGGAGRAADHPLLIAQIAAGFVVTSRSSC